MIPLLAADIGPDTIPGSVAIPTWVLIAAIVALFAAREWERKGWFSKMDAGTKALEALNATVDKLTDVISTCKVRP